MSGDVASVTALLDHKADPNGREREWGQTPLIFAAASNRAAVIRVLVERGADPSLQTAVVDAAVRSVDRNHIGAGFFFQDIEKIVEGSAVADGNVITMGLMSALRAND